MTVNELQIYGLSVFTTHHRQIRHLKRTKKMPLFGDRIWKSSWLLIDFIKQIGLPSRLRILDLGCGWGLSGIFCAKHYKAKVTCIDNDCEVFPYLHLHATVNQVEIVSRVMSIEDINKEYLKKFDVVLGADICFSYKLIEPLIHLIECSHMADVRSLVFADIGRKSFLKLSQYYLDCSQGQLFNWSTSTPYRCKGHILKFGAITHNK